MHREALQELAAVLQPPRLREGELQEHYTRADAQWAEVDAKEKYIESNAGEELALRDGPAGLCNYGATCYVSCGGAGHS